MQCVYSNMYIANAFWTQKEKEKEDDNNIRHLTKVAQEQGGC